MGSDPQYLKYPDLTVAQDVFNISNPSCPPDIQQGSLKKLQDAISENKMAPLYRHLAHPIEGILNSSGESVSGAVSSKKPVITSNMLASRKSPSSKIDFPWNEELYQSLVEDNKRELESFQKEEDDAQEAAGDTEVLAARGKRAEFWARVGDKVGSDIGLYIKSRIATKQQRLRTLVLYNRTKRLNLTKLFSRVRHSLEPKSTWCWP